VQSAAAASQQDTTKQRITNSADIACIWRHIHYAQAHAFLKDCTATTGTRVTQSSVCTVEDNALQMLLQKLHMPQTTPAPKVPATAPRPYDHQLTTHNFRQHQTQKTPHDKPRASRMARTAAAAINDMCIDRLTVCVSMLSSDTCSPQTASCRLRSDTVQATQLMQGSNGQPAARAHIATSLRPCPTAA
jgi:hypothetical protein